MSFDKLKNLFTRTFDSKDEDSLLTHASNFINSSRRSITENPLAEFESYLASISFEDFKNVKQSVNRSNRTASLRPQLVKKCYDNVPKTYFDKGYEINSDFFTRSRKESAQRTTSMHENLDEVEVCLYNQISSRFDEILSVLRTIQSLQCIVAFNTNRLAEVRQSNMQLAKQVSGRHLKIVNLLRRQEHLRLVIANMNQIKVYQSFLLSEASSLKLSKSSSQHYHSINEIRLNRDLYFQLESTKHFEERVEDFEASLKKSYSDNINDALFKYATSIAPYDANFWERKFLGRIIFEEDEKEGDTTAFLDQSLLVEEETGTFNIKLSEQVESDILANILNGWREGEYTVGNIKAAFDKFCKEKHVRFLSDCRNFAFQSYLRQDRKKIQNPSISNLLFQMNIFFCSKAFVYYADIYKCLLSRTFSVVQRSVVAFIEEAKCDLSIEEKEKIGLVVDGLFNIAAFVFKIVYDKVIEVIDMKQVHEATELSDFKMLINLFETEEDFIDKILKKYVTIKIPEDNFLAVIVRSNLNQLDLEIVTRAKKQKVEGFLNKTHRFILENELKESFENQIWQATDIPTFYYDSLHYLITGQSLNLRRNKSHTVRYNASANFESSIFIDRLGKQNSILAQNSTLGNFRIIRSEIIIDHKVYKVTQTLLLLLEIIQDYLHLAQFYPFMRNEVGVKIYELLRAYNISSNQLIMLGGAVQLKKIKTKNITAKHLALNSLCLSFLLYIMDCIMKRINIYQQQKIRKEIQDHEERTINKLKDILTGKINQYLPNVNLNSIPSKGTEEIVNNTKTLHDILVDFYGRDTLSKIFTKENVLLYLNKLRDIQIISKIQAQSLKDDLNFYFHELRFLDTLIPQFSMIRNEGEAIVKQAVNKFE